MHDVTKQKDVKPELVKLNLGCGPQIFSGWINVDYALGARWMKNPLLKRLSKKFGLFGVDWDDRIFIQDLTKPFSWQDNSVDVIYSSHTLEHLTRDDGLHFLRECYRVLSPRGVIRIVVPNLAQLVADYKVGIIAADEFVEIMGVLYEKNTNPIKNLLAPMIQYPHRCMYDTPALVRIMTELGFAVSGREPFDSEISDIEAIELHDRTENAVVVEGKKKLTADTDDSADYTDPLVNAAA